MEKDNAGQPLKVLIMGLDNSGKTSILISLGKKSNILSYCSLKPTKGIDICNFETDDLMISFWEFGGQLQYRADHLNNFNEYIEGANLIIYVIDIQDVKRYDSAIDYFKSIIKLIIEIDHPIELNIYLHKYDPNLKEQEKFKHIDDIIKTQLINKIMELIPSQQDYNFFNTTIYTIFEKNYIPSGTC